MAVQVKRRTRQPEEIPLASTSDIAFLLIIFFLAASALLEMRGVKVPLPVKDAPPMQIQKKDLFKIRIDETGAFHHDGRAKPLGELMTMVMEALRSNENLVVVLQASQDAPVESVTRILDELQKRKVIRISLSMEKAGGRR
jgi:biopolymer transport protein ExbD